MFKIYGLHTPIFIKVVLGAEEIGAPYEVISVDLMKGEHKTPDHLARHPFGKVPALEHNGKFVFESNAILRYMANVTNSPLYPTDHYERAIVDQWMDYFSMQLGSWCTSIWFHKCIAPKYFGETIDESFVNEKLESILGAMPVIEQHLANNTWLSGKNISIADVNAYMLVQGFEEAKIPLNDFPNFIKWYEAYKKRPAVERVQKWF